MPGYYKCHLYEPGNYEEFRHWESLIDILLLSSRNQCSWLRTKNCYLVDGITFLLSFCIHNNQCLAFNMSNNSGFR